MTQDIHKVYVYCNHEFLQESLCRQLSECNASPHFSVQPYAALKGHDLKQETDAVLYIDSDGSDAESLSHLTSSGLGHVHWLILTKGPDSPAAAVLREQLQAPSFCPIDISIDELAHILALLCKGRKVFVDSFCNQKFENGFHRRPVDLREDQYRLLGYLSEGLPNKVIATREGCDEALVKFRVRSLLLKLGVTNRTQAAVKAIAMGLAPVPTLQALDMPASSKGFTRPDHYAAR